MLLPTVGVTINIMSLFAFILVLGIVVDDAIIVAESAHAETEKSGYSLKSIVVGTKKVCTASDLWCVDHGRCILAAVAGFRAVGDDPRLPTLLCSVCCFRWWRANSFCRRTGVVAATTVKQGRITEAVDRSLKSFIENKYKPFLAKAIDYWYTTVAVFVSMILLVAGFFAGGFVKYGFFPDIENLCLRST